MGRSIVSFCGLCSMPATSRESQAEWNEITSECYSGFAHKACHVWSLSTSLVRVSDRVIVSSCPMSQDVPSLAVCFQEEDFLPPGSTMSRHKTEEHATLLHCYIQLNGHCMSHLKYGIWRIMRKALLWMPCRWHKHPYKLVEYQAGYFPVRYIT